MITHRIVEIDSYGPNPSYRLTPMHEPFHPIRHTILDRKHVPMAPSKIYTLALSTFLHMNKLAYKYPTCDNSMHLYLQLKSLE